MLANCNTVFFDKCAVYGILKTFPQIYIRNASIFAHIPSENVHVSLACRREDRKVGSST